METELIIGMLNIVRHRQSYHHWLTEPIFFISQKK